MHDPMTPGHPPQPQAILTHALCGAVALAQTPVLSVSPCTLITISQDRQEIVFFVSAICLGEVQRGVFPFRIGHFFTLPL